MFVRFVLVVSCCCFLLLFLVVVVVAVVCCWLCLWWEVPSSSTKKETHESELLVFWVCAVFDCFLIFESLNVYLHVLFLSQQIGKDWPGVFCFVRRDWSFARQLPMTVAKLRSFIHNCCCQVPEYSNNSPVTTITKREHHQNIGCANARDMHRLGLGMQATRRHIWAEQCNHEVDSVVVVVVDWCCFLFACLFVWVLVRSI